MRSQYEGFYVLFLLLAPPVAYQPARNEFVNQCMVCEGGHKGPENKGFKLN